MLCNLGPSTFKEIELQPAHPALSRSKAPSPILYHGRPIEHSLSPPLSSLPLLAIEIGERKTKKRNIPEQDAISVVTTTSNRSLY